MNMNITHLRWLWRWMVVVADAAPKVQRLAAQSWLPGLQACHSGKRLRACHPMVSAVRRPFPDLAVLGRTTSGLSPPQVNHVDVRGVLAIDLHNRLF